MTETTEDGNPISPDTALARDELRAASQALEFLRDEEDASRQDLDAAKARVDAAGARYAMLVAADLIEPPQV